MVFVSFIEAETYWWIILVFQRISFPTNFYKDLSIKNRIILRNNMMDGKEIASRTFLLLKLNLVTIGLLIINKMAIILIAIS